MVRMGKTPEEWRGGAVSDGVIIFHWRRSKMHIPAARVLDLQFCYEKLLAFGVAKNKDGHLRSGADVNDRAR